LKTVNGDYEVLTSTQTIYKGIKTTDGTIEWDTNKRYRVRGRITSAPAREHLLDVTFIDASVIEVINPEGHHEETTGSMPKQEGQSISAPVQSAPATPARDVGSGTRGAAGGIQEAARQGDLDKVKALVKGNPDLVSSKDSIGFTPLHCAAANGYKEMAEFLLANNADVNARDDDGETPLHFAADLGHKDLAEMLRRHGGHE
jgi:hypothetical protein